MQLEDEIFRKSKVDESTLIPYGFVKEKGRYKYTTTIMNDAFEIQVSVDKKGQVQGKVLEKSIGEEYTNFRVNTFRGSFVSSVKEAYETILLDIKEHCFIQTVFMSSQANRISERIKKEYQDEPKFIFKKSKDIGVFKNPNNEKWYGIIMNVKGEKVNKEDSSIDIMNVKLDEETVLELLKEPGYAPAYHMSKKSWISILLDDTLTDDQIMQRVKKSHAYTVQNDEWIVPANAKYYDMEHCFDTKDTILWKQGANVSDNDIVYLYVGTPYSCIFYQCVVEEHNIDFTYEDENLSMKKGMKLRLVQRFDHDTYTIEYLKAHGVKSVRSQRRLPITMRGKIK